MARDNDYSVLVGRRIVFSYQDSETHDRLHLTEGEVQMQVDSLVRISGKWYRRDYLILEAVLPVVMPEVPCAVETK